MKWWDLFVVTVVTGRRQFLGISVLSLLSLIILGFCVMSWVSPTIWGVLCYVSSAVRSLVFVKGDAPGLVQVL